MVGDALGGRQPAEPADGDTVTWFAVPEGSTADELAAAANPVTGVTAAYAISDSDATTSLAYADRGLARTRSSRCCRISTTRSLHRMPTACDAGHVRVRLRDDAPVLGRELRWTAPTVEPSGALALDGISTSRARGDPRPARAGRPRPTSCPTTPTSAARRCTGSRTCCSSPRELGDDDAADTAAHPLVEELTDWTHPDRCETETTRCFVYDPEAKGLVGKVASFGSDEFNDHHFHYGYLLYAAAIAVQDDPSLQKRLQPVMDLVAADLATDGGSSFFPDQRAFDAYAGHSWASGYVAVPRRQQPGVQLRGGRRVERPRPVGGCHRQRPARRRGAVDARQRSRHARRRTGSASIRIRACTRATTTRSSRSTGAASATTPRGSARSRPPSSASS